MAGADPPPLERYETEHERGYQGPGWRMPSPSPPYEVLEGDQWFYGYLRQWKLWPDGWYGLILWGNHYEARWVPESRLRPTAPRKVKSHRHRR